MLEPETTFRWNGPAAILFYVTIVLLVLLSLSPGAGGPVDPTEVGAFTFWTATSAMMTCIVALFRGWLRFLFWAIGLTIAAVFVMAKLNGLDGEILLFQIGLALPIFVTLETLKIFAGRFQKGADVEDSNEALQFGILHLLIVTTLVAVICSVGRWLVPKVIPMFNDQTLQIILSLQVVGVSTLLGVWAFLGKSSLLRIVCWFLISAALIWFVSVKILGDFEAIWMFIFSSASIGVGAMLILLRVDGVRFVKRKLS